MVHPDHGILKALCFRLQVSGGSHFLIGARCGLEDLTSKMPFGLLLQVSEAEFRVEGDISMPPTLICSFLVVHGQQVLWLLRLKAISFKNLFATPTSSQPREAFPDLLEEVGPSNCPWPLDIPFLALSTFGQLAQPLFPCWTGRIVQQGWGLLWA